MEFDVDSTVFDLSTIGITFKNNNNDELPSFPVHFVGNTQIIKISQSEEQSDISRVHIGYLNPTQYEFPEDLEEDSKRFVISITASEVVVDDGILNPEINNQDNDAAQTFVLAEISVEAKRKVSNIDEFYEFKLSYGNNELLFTDPSPSQKLLLNELEHGVAKITFKTCNKSNRQAFSRDNDKPTINASATFVSTLNNETVDFLVSDDHSFVKSVKRIYAFEYDINVTNSDMGYDDKIEFTTPQVIT